MRLFEPTRALRRGRRDCKQSRLRPALFVPALLLTAGVVKVGWAEEFEQHHAHEHGKITLNVALDGPQLLIELDAPAVNVVGFEHPPHTDTERAAVRHAAQLLHSGSGLIGLPALAACQLLQTELTEPKWEPEQPAHGKEAEAEEHADYEARLTYRCSHPEKLGWFEPWLLGKLLGVTEARIDLITPGGQRSESATDPHARIQLQ
jgi:hypothetical protein